MIEDHFAALREALERTSSCAPQIRRWGRDLAHVLDGGGRLLVCGNGGSAAEAQHLTGELVGRFRNDRRPFSAIALHADTSAGTAMSTTTARRRCSPARSERTAVPATSSSCCPPAAPARTWSPRRRRRTTSV